MTDGKNYPQTILELYASVCHYRTSSDLVWRDITGGYVSAGSQSIYSRTGQFLNLVTIDDVQVFA